MKALDRNKMKAMKQLDGRSEWIEAVNEMMSLIFPLSIYADEYVLV